MMEITDLWAPLENRRVCPILNICSVYYSVLVNVFFRKFYDVMQLIWY